MYEFTENPRAGVSDKVKKDLLKLPFTWNDLVSEETFYWANDLLLTKTNFRKKLSAIDELCDMTVVKAEHLEKLFKDKGKAFRGSPEEAEAIRFIQFWRTAIRSLIKHTTFS